VPVASGGDAVGFLNDLRTLSNQGNALREQYPVKQQLADASAQMQSVSAMLQQTTQQQSGGQRLLAEGVEAVAMITDARQTSALMNHNPLIELDLLVTMPNGVPIPVRRAEIVPLLHLARAQVGQQVRVRVLPDDANTIWIPWSAPA
jgi:hypothetical protein